MSKEQHWKNMKKIIKWGHDVDIQITLNGLKGHDNIEDWIFDILANNKWRHASNNDKPQRNAK
jgi:hypothetical protein